MQLKPNRTVMAKLDDEGLHIYIVATDGDGVERILDEVCIGDTLTWQVWVPDGKETRVELVDWERWHVPNT